MTFPPGGGLRIDDMKLSAQSPPARDNTSHLGALADPLYALVPGECSEASSPSGTRHRSRVYPRSAL